MLTRRTLLPMLPATALLPGTLARAAARPARLLIGTGTTEPSQSKGIYLADWNPETGEIGTPVLAAPLENPTWLALAPRAPHLYAISESRAGKVTAFDLRFGKGGTLTLNHLNEQSSDGAGPAHVSVSPNGHAAFVSNYGGGSLTSYALSHSGALSPPVSHFQYTPVDSSPTHAHPHAHQATPSPDGRFLLVSDLGSDRIWIYRVNGKSAALTANTPAFWQARTGSGPRHLVFHPNHRWVYSVNELDSTVDLLYWDSATGTLTTHGDPISTLPADFPKGKAFCSEILTAPDGRYVYVGNRRNETIAVLSVDASSGTLALAQLAPHNGRSARHVTLDPTGRFLLVALQDSNGIAVLRRDPATGKLSEPLHTYPIDSPQCLVFTS